MALVSAVCPQCGKQLQVDSTKEAAICEHCGSPFVTEKVIQMYSVSPVNTSMELEFGNSNERNKDFIIVAGSLKGYIGEKTEVVIPSNVIEIDNNAFANCRGITSVKIPNSVTSIGVGAFQSCSGLTSIKIPNSVTSIGQGAFWGCINIESVELPFVGASEDDETGYLSYIFEKNNNKSLPLGLTTVVITGSTHIPYSAFADCSDLTSITIPNTVTSIGIEAFKGCVGLTSITIPNSVADIDEEAFVDCRELTSITIPNSVTSIGRAAFSCCSNIKNITIPDSVVSIGEYAFLSWEKYQTIIFDGSKKCAKGFKKHWDSSCKAKIVFKG